MSDPSLNYYVAIGDTAARTAFTPSAATPAAGPGPLHIWYDTDLKRFFTWVSAAWEAASAAYSALLADIAGTSFSQGDVIYHNGSNLVRLAAGTSGHFLKTQGAGANPVWAAATATLADADYGDIVVSSTGTVWTVDNLAITSGKLASNAVTTAKITDANVTLAKIANAAANSRLVGSGASGSGAAYAELDVGAGLTIASTTLQSTSERRLASGYASVGTPAATTETDLQTYAMPGATLATDGQTIHVRAGGTLAATTRSRTVRAYFGATVLSSVAMSANTTLLWTIDIMLVRTGAATQTAYAVFFPAGSVGSNYITTRTTPAETLSGSVTIKVTGQVGGTPVANDITCDYFSVELLP